MSRSLLTVMFPPVPFCRYGHHTKLIRMNRPPGSGDAGWAQVIGRNVRRLRAAAGISLADLATAGAVSKTTLHGIELGQGNPTMSTLWALATALHVPLGELLEAAGPAVEITRSGDDRPQAAGDAVSARLLHRIRVRGTVEVYDIAVAPAAQHSDAHLPGVEECMVITRGQVITGPADDPAQLSERDSIRFGAARPHVYQGAGPDNRAVLLMIYPEP
jgi:transcriptional regulator with XRE-family HTH domain